MEKTKLKCEHCGKTKAYEIPYYQELDDVKCKHCGKASNLVRINKN